MPLTTLMSMKRVSWGIFLASKWADGVDHVQRCLSNVTEERVLREENFTLTFTRAPVGAKRL